MNWEELEATLLTWVVRHAPQSITLAQAKEIASDLAWMIKKGRTLAMELPALTKPRKGTTACL